MALDINDPEAVRRAAREIVSRPEFAQEEETFWKKFLHYLQNPWELVDPVFEWISDQLNGSGAAPLLAWGVVTALGVGIIVLAIWLTRSTSSDNVVPVAYAPNVRGRSVRDLLAEATRFEVEHRWRDAIRSRYAVLITQLASNGVVRQRPGRTTGEYVAEVNQNLPRSATSFQDATRLFEWVWYGDSQPSSDDVDRFKALASAVDDRVSA